MGLHESKQYSEIKVKNTNFEWLTFIGHFIPIYTHIQKINVTKLLCITSGNIIFQVVSSWGYAFWDYLLPIMICYNICAVR